MCCHNSVLVGWSGLDTKKTLGLAQNTCVRHHDHRWRWFSFMFQKTANIMILVFRLINGLCRKTRPSARRLAVVRYNILKAHQRGTTWKRKLELFKLFVRKMVLKVRCGSGGTTESTNYFNSDFFIIYSSYYVNDCCHFILRPDFVRHVLIFIFVFVCNALRMMGSRWVLLFITLPSLLYSVWLYTVCVYNIFKCHSIIFVKKWWQSTSFTGRY